MCFDFLYNVFSETSHILTGIKRDIIINVRKPFTGRPVGRPKSRWEDDVRNDLKKTKLIKWTENVQDRLKWKGIVEKAKTQPEL